MLTKVLTYSFYLLFALTPLIWTPLNYELFEYNKMMFVYFLTVVIAGAWLIKMVNRKSLIVNRTPLDIPLLLFLGANILSTFLSIDPHTSIWGYYSRSNGGLLSIVSYTLLFFALVSNFESKDVPKFLKAALLGGLVVSAWAIPEHFGLSPSCLILRGELNASCWVQDVQARVFATLGQPNWLAAYFAMLIFPTIYFFLTAQTLRTRITYLVSLIAFYLAFTFTYSRGATLGFLAGLSVFIVFQLLALQTRFAASKFFTRVKPVGVIILTFLSVNLIFGSAFGRFNLSTPLTPPLAPAQETSTSNVTQLEAGGTESGQIRFIVWQGALEIFKHSPFFGSGVETFAYSYYQFRPLAHNLVSEWDFLYNKAHNEYLNYLATTGIVGFASYMAVIITFIVYSIWYIVYRKNKKSQYTTYYILHTALLASYTSYLVQNIFGFSVVVIALFFYLFPALVFLSNGDAKPLVLRIPLLKSLFRLKIWTFVVILASLFSLFTLTKNWLADTYFALGSGYSEAGESSEAYKNLSNATFLNSKEPLYKSELGFAASQLALLLAEEDATSSAEFIREADQETEMALNISRANVSFWRTAIRTYYQLSTIDSHYNQKTLDALDKAIALAPTDAKLYYNKGLILSQMERVDEGIESLKKAVELKPNYHEAHYTLGILYESIGDKEKAIEEMEIILKLIPNEPEALKKLEELRK